MPKADATVDRARKDGKELKRFCNRALSMLSLKLCLIRMIEFGEGSHIDSDRAWASAFEELSEPSVLKMIRFALACRNAKANADLIVACDVMVNSACSLT